MEPIKAYSSIVVKAVDEEKRRITGIASTPSTDRVGDIVLPKGAKFKLPIPFLWQHDHLQPIGNVVEAKVTSKGIEVVVELVKIDDPSAPSQLVARLEEAWQSIKHKLVRGLSIGFSPLKYALIDGGGYEFIEWSWLELSAVTVPCNVDATIATIKSLSEKQAAFGKKVLPVVSVKKSASAMAPKLTSILPVEGSTMDIQEQITSYSATLEAKKAAAFKIMEKAASEGRTLDAAEADEYSGYEAEIESLEKHIDRLKTMQKHAANTSTPVTQVATTKAAAENRNGALPAVAKNTQKLEKGIEFARYVMCLGAAKGELSTALAISQKRFPEAERIHVALKAAVDAGTTTDATWASPLVEYNQFAGDFVEYLRPRTIIGRFGENNIPSLRSIPFNQHIRGQTSGGSASWVGQAKGKPLTKFDFNDAYLGFTKVAAISVLTEELMRFSNPSAERLVRDSLAEAIIERIDQDFIDPAITEVSGVRPASITNGVSAITSTGNDADSIRTDVKAAMATFIAANNNLASGVWIMSATRALALSLMRNALGQKEFPDLTMLGGTFEGLPVIVSQYVPSITDGDYVILVNASDVWLADDGQVTVNASREASLQMDTDPTNASNDATPTALVSMFQTNCVAIRAERYINWKKRRTSAVAVISGVNWGDE